MHTWLPILISAGLSADVLATAACEGARLARIGEKEMILSCALFAAWQFAALGAGNLTAKALMTAGNMKNGHDRTRTTAVLLIVIAIRCAAKAVKERHYEEQRSAFRMKDIVRPAMLTSADVLIAGIGFGFMNL